MYAYKTKSWRKITPDSAFPRTLDLRMKNGFRAISFEYICVLDSYFIHHEVYGHKIQVKFDH